jgi:post-GPI attachment to proteins factor 2
MASGDDCSTAQRKPTIDRPSDFAQLAATLLNGDPVQVKKTLKGHGGDGCCPLFRIGFSVLARVTVVLPFGALVFCFVTAVIFQFEEVNKTVCNVTNLVPSISAITGVTPQRYIWRICIALHSTPRFAIGFIYWYYYLERECFVRAVDIVSYRRVCNLTVLIYMIENACLIGLTYIANIENYPVHEKLFILFMISSLLYELLTIIVFRWCHPTMNNHIMKSYNLKRICFVLIIVFTAGMLYFFYYHRFHCIAGAFTKFACCEYVIVVLNITYHYSSVHDFGEHDWHFNSKTRHKIDANDNHKSS